MDTPVRWAVGLVVAILIVAMLVFLRGVPIGPHPSHPIALGPVVESAA